MNSHRKRLLLALSVAASLGLAAGPAGAADPGDANEELVQVGNAAKITRLVNGHIGDEVRSIPLMGKVYQNEMIETGAASATEIKFLDNTKLTIGPKAKLVLDSFVFDPRPNKGKMVLSATKGVFRFVTGKLSANAYKIKTPVATMGVRGTAFTLIVEDDGQTTVSVTNGEVSVTNVIGDSVWVKPGLTTTVAPRAKKDKAPPPPAAPKPTPPSVDEAVGEMDIALSEGEEGEDVAEAGEELAEEEAGEEAAETAEAADQEALTAEEEAVLEAVAEASEVEIPEDLLTGVLDGDEESLAALEAFLKGEKGEMLSPEDVTGRAVALIEALKEMMGTSNPELLLAAADRISSAAVDSLDAATIVQLNIDPSFVPPPGVLAFDFGPEDGETAEGFEKITDKDARLDGEQMNDMRRPGEDEMLGDGILGIKELTLDVPDNVYRMILITENIDGSPNPFGLSIEVNGLKRNIFGGDPENWLPQASLGAGGIKTDGGVIILEVVVVNGKLNIKFDFGEGVDFLPYLTGLILEPADQPSSLLLNETAEMAYTGLDKRLLLEGVVSSSVAGLLSEVATAAGGEEPDILDLPDPIFEPDTPASPA